MSGELSIIILICDAKLEDELDESSLFVLLTMPDVMFVLLLSLWPPTRVFMRLFILLRLSRCWYCTFSADVRPRASLSVWWIIGLVVRKVSSKFSKVFGCTHWDIGMFVRGVEDVSV